MKLNLSLLAAIVIFSSATLRAQSPAVAQDWTKSDCSGNMHHLFGDLADGKVVLMQFDMMYCSYCTAAAINTNQIIKDFQVSNPGRVVMYSLGYTNETTCDLMKTWVSTNKFSFDIIEKCPNELAYYGDMGMPTIVIVGGWDHKVYYQKLGFSTADNANIKAAINAALLRAGVQPITSQVSDLSMYPNPAGLTSKLNYTLESNTEVKVDLFDMLGNKVQSISQGMQNAGKYSLDINTSSLANGIYFVRINGNTLKMQVAN